MLLWRTVHCAVHCLPTPFHSSSMDPIPFCECPGRQGLHGRLSMPAGCLHGVGWARFAKKNVSLISDANLDPFHMCFTIFHYKISLPFFRFFSLIFASNFSLRFDLVIFASKRNRAKRNSSLFFRFFPLFFAFFAFFTFCHLIFV